MSDTIVCIPTYNEAQNIQALVELILVTEPSLHVLVVDDNSPDGTARVVEKLQSHDPRVFLLKRTANKGFANSYKDGFAWANQQGYKYLIQMDADFSHHPRYIGAMLALRDQYDFVVGSRYTRGGKIVNWPLKRRVLSAGGNLYARLWLGCPLRDMTTGFTLWSLKALERINVASLKSDGYSFLVELKFFSYLAGLSSREVPIIFEDRKAQESKMSGAIFREAVTQIPMLRFKSMFSAKNDNTTTQQSAPTKPAPTYTEHQTQNHTEHKKVVGID